MILLKLVCMFVCGFWGVFKDLFCISLDHFELCFVFSVFNMYAFYKKKHKETKTLQKNRKVLQQACDERACLVYCFGEELVRGNEEICKRVGNFNFCSTKILFKLKNNVLITCLSLTPSLVLSTSTLSFYLSLSLPLSCLPLCHTYASSITFCT